MRFKKLEEEIPYYAQSILKTIQYKYASIFAESEEELLPYAEPDDISYDELKNKYTTTVFSRKVPSEISVDFSTYVKFGDKPKQWVENFNNYKVDLHSYDPEEYTYIKDDIEAQLQKNSYYDSKLFIDKYSFSIRDIQQDYQVKGLNGWVWLPKAIDIEF